MYSRSVVRLLVGCMLCSFISTVTGNFIVSRARTTTDGLLVGTAAVLDMQNGVRALSGAHAPGNAIGTSSAETGSFWVDWGNDIFDNWGYFYIYNPSSNSYLHFTLSSRNLPIGSMSTQIVEGGGRKFSLFHGFPVQGIYRFEIVSDDDQTFVFGAYGNMGSDSNTENANKEFSYSLDGESFTLHYNWNTQTGTPIETFHAYFVPYEKNLNKETRTFEKFLDVDNLSLYSKPVRYGLNVYFAKEHDVRSWIIADLASGTRLLSLFVRPAGSQTPISLSPAFSPLRFSFVSGVVGSAVESVDVVPSCLSENCEITINSISVASDSALSVSTNSPGLSITLTIFVLVPPFSFSTRYLVSVRRMSTNPRLSNLLIRGNPGSSQLVLSPSFSPTTEQVIVARAKPFDSSVSFVPFCQQSPCTVRLNGTLIFSGTWSIPFPLGGFEQSISYFVHVTSEDESATHLYRLLIHRVSPPEFFSYPRLGAHIESRVLPSSTEIIEFSIVDPFFTFSQSSMLWSESSPDNHFFQLWSIGSSKWTLRTSQSMEIPESGRKFHIVATISDFGVSGSVTLRSTRHRNTFFLSVDDFSFSLTHPPIPSL